MTSFARDEGYDSAVGTQKVLWLFVTSVIAFCLSLPVLSPRMDSAILPIINLPIALSFALFLARKSQEARWIALSVFVGSSAGLIYEGHFSTVPVLVNVLTLVESFIVAKGVHRFLRTDRPLTTATDVHRFIAIIVIVPGLFAIFPLALNSWKSDALLWTDSMAVHVYAHWVLCNGLTYLVFGSVFWLGLKQGNLNFFYGWGQSRKIAFWGTSGALVLSALFMADVPWFDYLNGRGATNMALLFLPIPWLMIMAGAYDTKGAAIGSLIYAVLTIYPAATGWGEVWGPSPEKSVEAIQLYVGMPVAAAFVLSAYVRMVKDRNRALAQLNKELQAALSEVDQSRKVKENFLAMMSHELRTPLNAVIGFSDLIKEQSFGPIRPKAYANLATNINSSGQRLLSMIEGLLYATEEDKRIADFEKSHVLFSDAIDTAVNIVSDEAAAKSVRVNVKADLPLAIDADKRALQQIFYNVLENAVRYSPKKSTVSVVLSADGANSKIQVIDEGAGFDVGPWVRRIEMPTRLSPTPERGHGNGYGLAVARTLAYGHGGSVEIESSQSTGTVVTITFYATHDASSPFIAVV